MKTSFGEASIKKFDRFLQDSIEYGLEHTADAIDYAMQYGRNKPRNLIEKFVKMYVNKVTVNMGTEGEDSIKKVFEMSRQKNLTPEFDLKIV